MPLYPSFFVDSAAAAAGYQIEQSLRFNDDDSAYLQLNGGTSPTDGKIFTHSVWVKRSGISGNDNNVFGSAPTSTLYNDIKFDSNDQLYYRQIHSSGGASQWTLKTSARYRDPSAWLHIVVAVDTTQATSSDRVKMYVNGAQITQFDSESYPGQNQVPLGQNGSYAVGIGRLTPTFTNYFDGYMAEYHHVDGTAHDPTDFGEYDDNGVWRPIEVTGITYGNRGWYLTFDSTATNGIGHDHSGNGNHFTANNFTTSGIGTDVMSDTPTTNWCTFNPIDTGFSGSTLSNGNLNVTTASTGFRYMGNTIWPSAGKFYAEIKVTSTSGFEQIGIATRTTSTNKILGTDADSWAYDGWDGQYINNGTQTTFGSTYTTNDIVGIALDRDNHKLYFSKNGTWQNSADPAAGTGSINISSISGVPTMIAVCDNNSGGSSGFEVNFGQRDFAYTPPTNFLPLNTANLPAPDIADGSDYFNTVLYTGTGTTNARTDVGFQPDLTWIKIRSLSSNHAWYDVLRGATKVIGSSATDSEITDGSVTPTSTGFTLGSENTSFGSTNGSGYTYVAWNWKAGGSGSSNTDGSITSTVSANPTAGFSIVTYTGTNVSGATVGHGLGVAPKMIIIKNRSSIEAWPVYHAANTSAPETDYLVLNTTAGTADATTAWNDTLPNSTVFTLGNWNALNENGSNHVAYCFAEVEGYSKFGSYTGNGSSDGPFVATSFAPAFLIWKRTDSTANWFMVDAARNTYNPVDKEFYSDQSNAENTFTDVDFLSNGFKLRASTADRNANGGTFVYMCFASNPFGGSGVSPATAR